MQLTLQHTNLWITEKILALVLTAFSLILYVLLAYCHH